MKEIEQKSKNKTLKNKEIWTSSLYSLFLKNCNKEEFLQSQIPFFYAVQAFPQMLLKLALLIETSEERLLVMENLWEEHGNGNSEAFHTTTFKKHLKSLGHQDEIIFKNPYITEWINDILKNEYTVSELGSILAGIEYMYAVISEDIAEYMNSLSLDCEPVHYKKHSKLDWSHGVELLDVVLGCEQDIDFDAFQKSQVDFINVFEKMILPTEKELNKVSEHPVSFFYSREDSEVELNVLNSFDKENVDIFSICSGGEHILEYISKGNKNITVDVFDVNESQINVFKNKLNGEKQAINGKFEYLFGFLRSMLNEYDNKLYTETLLKNKDKLKYLTNIIFSRKNLNIIFTENATKYSSKNFAEHFYNAFILSLESNNINALNVFFNIPILKEFDYSEKDNYKLNYIVSNMISFDFDKQYDLIDLSNIGDWMPLDEYQEIINKANMALNKNGKLIVRKLLGDYSLEELLLPFNNVSLVQDSTYFYSQCYIASKAA